MGGLRSSSQLAICVCVGGVDHSLARRRLIYLVRNRTNRHFFHAIPKEKGPAAIGGGARTKVSYLVRRMSVCAGGRSR